MYRLVFILLVVFLLLSAVPTLSTAAIINVTNTNDAGAGSLRQAVADTAAGDEIRFNVTGTITLTSGQILINKNLTITGPGARQLTIDGNTNKWIFLHSDEDFIISGLNLINVDGNQCIYSDGGTIAVSDCRFEGINGQGLFFDLGNNGFTVERCLFTNCNRSGGSSGGGLASTNNDGTITNCTFSGNSVGGSGGALAFWNGGTVKISHCTITGNESQGGNGGGIATWALPTVRLRNTIVAGNTDTSGTNRPNLVGKITSHDYNLIGDDTGAIWDGGTQGNDRVDVADTGLDPLRNNCGPTNTHALEEGGPALDNGVGTDIDGGNVIVDQRGANRPWETEYDIGAFEHDPTFTCPTSPDVPGPSPNLMPPGGPAHQLGGGGPNINPPLPPGYTWTPNGQSGTPQDLTMALANPGGGAQPATGPARRNEQIPGLMFQRTCPKGSIEECWLPLGETGVMPSGVQYTTQMSWNYDVRVIDLDCNWPQAVIDNLASGSHCLTYWLQTPEGLRSNCRVQHLICGQATDTTAGKAPVKRNAKELTFKLQVSLFSEDTGFVERIKEGMCEVEVDGETYDTFPIVEGILTAKIPFGRDCLIKFIAQEFGGYKRVRIEFKDGFMYAYDHDYRDAVVPVYGCLDGQSYAIEYYRNKVYICNQGADPDGPILGMMFGR